MKQLSLKKELYAVDLLDPLIAAFEPFAIIERHDTDDAVVVHVTAQDGFDESTLVGELGNHALGATIDAATKEKGA